MQCPILKSKWKQNSNICTLCYFRSFIFLSPNLATVMWINWNMFSYVKTKTEADKNSNTLCVLQSIYIVVHLFHEIQWSTVRSPESGVHRLQHRLYTHYLALSFRIQENLCVAIWMLTHGILNIIKHILTTNNKQFTMFSTVRSKFVQCYTNEW